MPLEKTYLPAINFVYDRLKWMNDNTRKAILIICIVAETLSTYIYQCDEYFGFLFSASVNTVIGIICLTGIIIAGIDSRINEIRSRKWLIYILMLCGIVVFISGLHHYISYSYMLMGLFMCFMMPAVIIVWGDNNHMQQLFTMTAYIISVFFIIFAVVNFIVAPVNNPEFSLAGRYFGMASDPNGLAKIAVTAAICSIYLILLQRGMRKIPFIVIFLAAAYLTVLTASRTNIIALILVCAAAVIFLIKRCVINRKYSAKKIIICVCAVIVIIGIVGIGHNLLAKDGDDNISTIEMRLSQGIMEDGSIDINTLSSGRITIWKYCLSKTSIMGNDVSEGLREESLGMYHDHVHNTVIELLYRSGLVAGISFPIIEMYAVIWALVQIFARRKNSLNEIMAAMLVIAFGVASVFDIVVLPFAKMTVFLFYISLPVVFAKKEKDNIV